ncbi:MAG: hypothetical protein AB2728_15060 [Candidatus Thiodiazotropha sp.]|nr:hypothetical protein [Candidatus Thiodiazotropha taylori]MBT3059143.1 hypothetical protein [Candidatus Thiodiazotropha sp. (ex Lucina pensylvanica)]MBT3064112.1 hypothetical protein [Candidatus Thiodiazotropha sp. (ex Lucina pensylvanica)]MBV2093381.1 hypothetical protein [Candidatus Thiodiazotropha sp. (ex Codakia orbicularis)]
MNCMDVRARLFLSCWKEAVCSSQSKHKFRTHTREEALSFERMLAKRDNSGKHLIHV